MKQQFSQTLEWPLGISILRIMAGIMFMQHGLVIFNAAEMAKTIDFFGNTLFLPAPAFMAWLAKGAEFFCGCLLILGLFSKMVLGILIIDMVVALTSAAKWDIFSHGELPFVYLLFFILLILSPTDKYSIVSLFKKSNS